MTSLNSLVYSLVFRISLGLFVAFFPVGVAPAAEKSDIVVNRMAAVGVFAFGGVGFTGAISPGEKDYRLVLSQPSAEADFEKLFAIGDPQAKCYALVGLRQLNPEKFKVLCESLRSSKAAVTTMHGCIMRHEAMTAILAGIQAGKW